ncbi:hypothetical protein SB861_49720 [Paraburkholderia sp. SIMBA_049]
MSEDRARAADTVMAWARDRETGEARYILEIDGDHRGGLCNCECVDCGAPLIAVNAARSSFIRRPHFRHSEAVERRSCIYTAARMAMIISLVADGFLDLPARQRPARVTGLSGCVHEAWAEVPAERVQIDAWSFVDSAEAMLTLEDGRELRVLLVGTSNASVTDDDAERPPGMRVGEASIQIIVDDPAIAGMSPDELRNRTTLAMKQAHWCGHWDDRKLAASALEQGRAAAVDALDWPPGAEALPEGFDRPAARETLLHRTAKEILAREKRLIVPAVILPERGGQTVGQTPASVGRTARMLNLATVALEQAIGRIRPDVCATTEPAPGWPAETLHIEITVTHKLDAGRLDRIWAAGFATLEIDLSRLGGKVTRAEFERLIVDELAGKSWVHHPAIDEERRKIQAARAREAEAARQREARGTSGARYPTGSRADTAPPESWRGSRDGNLWLKGAALERWKKEHPERAAELERWKKEHPERAAGLSFDDGKDE